MRGAAIFGGAMAAILSARSRLDIDGHGRRGNVAKVSGWMVGAIGFEPMTSTV
jgi:hypothetical protein